MSNELRTLRINAPWVCPVCGETLSQGSTHLRSGHKPDIYTKHCKSCKFALIWTEMKEGFEYSISAHRVKEES